MQFMFLKSSKELKGKGNDDIDEPDRQRKTMQAFFSQEGNINRECISYDSSYSK